MPDLSIESVRQFWLEYEDPAIYRVVTFMEGVEEWTLDGDEDLELAIEQLSQELDEITEVDMTELGNEEGFIRLAANIKSGRALRLLHAIDSVHPGAASRLLVHAEETSESPEDPAGVFLRRNIVFERLRLLSRVFSNERISLVVKALEGED